MREDMYAPSEARARVWPVPFPVGSAPSRLAQGLLMAPCHGKADLLQTVARSNVGFFLRTLSGHPGKMSPVKPTPQSRIAGGHLRSVLAAHGSPTPFLHLTMPASSVTCYL